TATSGDQCLSVLVVLTEQCDHAVRECVLVECQRAADLVTPGVSGVVDNGEILPGGRVPKFRERSRSPVPVDVSGEDTRTVLGAEAGTPPGCFVQILRNRENRRLAVDFLAHECRGAAVR